MSSAGQSLNKPVKYNSSSFIFNITSLVNKETYLRIKQELGAGVILVAVSKMKTAKDILQLYELGQKDFGENYVQELLIKQPELPPDIKWHFIGHLQSNKVKSIASFIHLVHSVDSLKLYKELRKEAIRYSRTIECLLQVHIAREESKFGLTAEELQQLVTDIKESGNNNDRPGAIVKGLMGMASFTENQNVLAEEFNLLQGLFTQYQSEKNASLDFQYLSMGMSNDYQLALKHGSNIVRIGSLLFGNR